jgi:hypothetical protein
VLDGSPNSNIVYVSPDPSAVSQQIMKVNISTGRREPFVTISPSNATGIIAVFRPIFSSAEKRYVDTQIRDFSVLCVGTGLK